MGVGGADVKGEHSAVGQASIFRIGRLTNEGSLINWTYKCSIGSSRRFNYSYPFCFRLGEDLYFIGYDKNFVIQPDGARKGLKNYSYCDRYSLKNDEYTTDVHSVPSDFGVGPKIVLKDKQETFALITAGPNREWTFLFAADEGFNDARKVIGSKNILFNYYDLFYRPQYLIKIL